MRIALAGNPNSGKTTMFNALTGASEMVGNWAGVTVDKKAQAIKKIYAGNEDVIAVDLPGAYSMSPFTSEESITSEFVKTENPDVIINIVDATNLSRSLFFTTQLLELGIPVVVALNKADVNRKRKTPSTRHSFPKSLAVPSSTRYLRPPRDFSRSSNRQLLSAAPSRQPPILRVTLISPTKRWSRRQTDADLSS